MEYATIYGHEPSLSDLEDYFTELEGGHRPARAVGVYIRKMWSSQVFDFNVFYLDKLISFLKNLCSYRSWNHFVEKETWYSYGHIGEKCRHRKYSDLDDRIKQLLNVVVDARAASIFLDFGRNKYDIDTPISRGEWYDSQIPFYKKVWHQSWLCDMFFFTNLDLNDFRPIDKEIMENIYRSICYNSY